MDHFLYENLIVVLLAGFSGVELTVRLVKGSQKSVRSYIKKDHSG